MPTATTHDSQVEYGPVRSSAISWEVTGDETNDGSLTRTWTETARQWWGRSSYVRRVFGRTITERRSSWSLLAISIILASAAIMTLLAGIGHSPVLLLVGFAFGLSGYALFWRWVAANRYRSRTNWFLERVRCCLACEGDPGPRQLSRGHG
jgi:hypothetical protein